jgi:hypothetical protein
MTTEAGQFGTYRVIDDPISKGGVGSIHRTSDPRFVFKRYFAPAKAPSPEHLDRLISVGRNVLISQGRQPGDTPESSVNWPVDMVTNPLGVSGVLLPTIPQALFHEEFGNVRTLDFLVMARARPPLAKGRVALLLRMAEILAFVNARGLVHGDINSKNLAWSIQPQPIMYLIDCDGMLPQQPPPTVGVQAMGWTDPRLVQHQIPAHDQYSDWYALALAMYRGLLLTPGKLDKAADGSWPGPSRIPDRFPARVAALIRRGLDPLNGPQRATPAEWVEALRATYLPGNIFDEAGLSELDALSAQQPTAQPFTPFPQTDWGSTSPPRGSPPPRPTPPRPKAPPPPGQQRPAAPPPPTTHRRRTAPPRPMAPPTYGPGPGWQVDKPLGRLAESALTAGAGWYIVGFLASLILPWIAIFYIAIALFQLRNASNYSGVTRARVMLRIYAGICLLSLIPTIIALAQNGS